MNGDGPSPQKHKTLMFPIIYKLNFLPHLSCEPSLSQSFFTIDIFTSLFLLHCHFNLQPPSPPFLQQSHSLLLLQPSFLSSQSQTRFLIGLCCSPLFSFFSNKAQRRRRRRRRVPAALRARLHVECDLRWVSLSISIHFL